MSNLLLFVVGFIITSLVFFSVGGLIYAAHLDGEYNKRREQEDEDQPD